MKTIADLAKALESNDSEVVKALRDAIESVDDFEDFKDEASVSTYEKLICGYKVHYSLAKTLLKEIDGGIVEEYESEIYGIFEPLTGKTVYDEKIYDQVKQALKNLN